MTFIAESDRPLLPAVERGRAHVDVAVLRSSTYERRSARDHTRSRQGVYTENAASTHSVEASATISPLSDRLILSLSCSDSRKALDARFVDLE
jgi:hypothetical protein